MTQIVQTSAGQFFRVAEVSDADLSHCWNGTEVKRTKAGWVEKANARSVLVRKAGSEVVS